MAALGALLLAGCVTYERGVLVAAADDVPALDTELLAEDARGRSCGPFEEAGIVRAVEDALSRTPGANALIDVRYGFDRFCITVRGRAVRVRH